MLECADVVASASWDIPINFLTNQARAWFFQSIAQPDPIFGISVMDPILNSLIAWIQATVIKLSVEILHLTPEGL